VISGNRRERRAKKRLAKRATRQAVRQNRREGGDLGNARRIMREKLAQVVLHNHRKREPER
jgi:hypothetical protein